MNKISVDINIFESQLRGQIASDLNTLQIILDAIKKPDFSSNQYILTQNFTSAVIAIPPAEFLKQREINKCFKSIIGSFQDYMDNLLALLLFKKETISVLPNTSFEEFQKLVDESFNKHLLEISTDRSLNIPKKLDKILDGPEHQVYKEALQSYFDVRNGLEHHKGIAKANRVVKYRRFGLASTAGYEVKELPTTLGENEGLVLKAFDEEIAYDKGGVLLISQSQLDGIVLNLLVTTIPVMQIAISTKFNAE